MGLSRPAQTGGLVAQKAKSQLDRLLPGKAVAHGFRVIFLGSGGDAPFGVGEQGHLAGGARQGRTDGVGHLPARDDPHLVLGQFLETMGEVQGRSAQHEHLLGVDGMAFEHLVHRVDRLAVDPPDHGRRRVEHHAAGLVENPRGSRFGGQPHLGGQGGDSRQGRFAPLGADHPQNEHGVGGGRGRSAISHGRSPAPRADLQGAIFQAHVAVSAQADGMGLQGPDKRLVTPQFDPGRV